MNQTSKIGPTADEKNKWTFNLSEYNYRYHTFTRPDQVAAKPAAVRLLDNRETFRTGEEVQKLSSYEYDYAEKPITAPIRVKRDMGPSSIAPNADLKMECYSSYKSCFDQKDTRPAQAVRPPPPQGLGWKDSTDLDLRSVNMFTYRPYTADEVNRAKREKILILPEYGTIETNRDCRPSMDFQTTVKQNFVKHNGCFRPAPAPGSIKTPAHGIAGIAGADITAKMDLTTTHTQAFSSKNAVVNQNEIDAVPPLIKDKSAKVPGWYKSIDIDFQNELASTQMRDYIGHSGVVRPKSFQPLHVYNPPSTKFHENTLYKNAFTEHGNQRRKPMVPAPRKKDEQVISHVVDETDIYRTEYNRIYQKAPLSFIRPKAIVPKTTKRIGGKFFEGTSYRQNFNLTKDMKTARVPSFSPKKISDPWYKSGGDDEQFTSTTREHYQGEFAVPATICKPKIKQDGNWTEHGNANTREASFETEYGNCFETPRIMATNTSEKKGVKTSGKNICTPRTIKQM